MKYEEKKPAVLYLADGTVFHGKSSGAPGTTSGEICFNTGMTGYQEIFTDPSYYGQLLVATHVHIGNYGVHAEEVESDSIKIAGLICRSFDGVYSRKSASGSVRDYFLAENKVAISGVDTRAVVRHIRSKGAMNAIVSSEILDIPSLAAELEKCPSMEGLELSSRVTTQAPYFFGDPSSRYRVAVIDFGVKKNTLRHLAARNCYICVFPSFESFDEIKKWNPDGVLLSNGPGDPSVMPEAVATIRRILDDNTPLFGICLGHQLLAEACGLTTYKMHHGHRGINHPVKNLLNGRCEITSQNHGFAVSPDAVKQSDRVDITHVNLNDQSVEGIRVKDKVAFSVQYHPESAPGPHDSTYLFDEFVDCFSRVSVEA